MLEIDEALAAILDAITPLAVERVALGEGLGRVLAQSVSAREDAPPFDASAMDGWAVRSAELTSAPRELPIRGESRAGGAWPDALAPGTTMRIFTGAPMPAGADAVVMQEDVEVRSGSAQFRVAPRPAAHVRARGEDLRAGDPILALGATIGSGEIALLASQGIGEIAARGRPTVAILTNGDELRDVGDAPRPGSIIDANAPAIAAAVREAGGVPLVLPRAPD
ncbi:MAG: molybdopterin molybdotransferase MoeA, partial [Myxococcota bacterium]|nr:molybdopterin molybdotransferase MoeA [Myxococcota bacterium]